MLKSQISVSAEQEEERTVLKNSFHNAPYKVVHYGGKLLHRHLELIIMSASPGMMDGDELTIQVEVQKNAKLRLFTQSFNKLHPMIHGARQETSVNIKPGGVFQYIPHPVTPFKESIFKTVNQIHMSKEASLIWGDIIASGRVHSGESFQFSRLHSVTKVFVHNKLLLLDNQLLEPGKQPIESLLFYEGFTHQATLIYVSPYGDALKKELDEILIGQYKEISFGFTQCGPNAVMIRALGNDGNMLYDWLLTMGQLCWEFTLDQIQEAESANEDVQKGDYIPVLETSDNRMPEIIETETLVEAQSSRSYLGDFIEPKAIEPTVRQAVN